MKKIILFLSILLFPLFAHGATCPAKYYLNETTGECVLCRTDGYYCPGDDTRHACPTTDTDYSELYSADGFMDVTLEYFQYLSDGTKEPGEVTWTASTGDGTGSVSGCRGRFLLMNEDGNVGLFETMYNGTNYYVKPNTLTCWFVAANGYYLSDYKYRWSSRITCYRNAKQCTNAPTNAHYTGPGTPDSADGTIVDANDCPWECDAGYGQTASGTCAEFCDAGITQLKTSNGLSFNIYANKLTTPALNLLRNNTVCYVNLSPGVASGTINVQYDNAVYHTTD